MNIRSYCCSLIALSLTVMAAGARAGEVFLNEILFNPPGTDTNTEYVEIRGLPNQTLPTGLFLVSVEGDTNGNPGTIQNVVDLSRRTLGQNGFLCLLQKASRYKPNAYSTVLANTGPGDGWGSGGSSSIRHRGEGGQIDLENPSCTFLLIQCSATPTIEEDIDANNDGTPDGAAFQNWQVLDSVGILDSDSSSDLAYGRINFVRGSGNAALSGTVVSVPFTPGYVARNGNTTGWSENDWVASDNLVGLPPKWRLGANSTLGTNTVPAARSRYLLKDLGTPNFGALPLPSVLIREIGTNTHCVVGGRSDGYFISLATRPVAPVTVRATAEAPLELSLDGKVYASSIEVSLATQKGRKVFVRAPSMHVLGPATSHRKVIHAIASTLDPAHYPASLNVAPLSVSILEPYSVLLSEAKVNPPGTNDGPFEFIEVKGPPGRVMTNLYLLALDGNKSGNPGFPQLVLNLSGQSFGSNGLLVITAPGNPYEIPSTSHEWPVTELGEPSGVLDNGSLSILLVGTWEVMPSGTDLDAGNNGNLEGLPSDASIQDSVGWRDSQEDVVYGNADLSQDGFSPDAVSRIPGNLTPNSALAWMAGDLKGVSGDSLEFEITHLSTNLPAGSLLSPGVVNRTAPFVSPLAPLSHVIGDPWNARVEFVVSDDETPAASLIVSAISTNPAVVPNGNLVLTRGLGGKWTLGITPVAAGYSDIEVRVSDGLYTGLRILHYAASIADPPGGLWFSGISDASTAMPIDAKWMFVGDDENQIIRLYSRTQSGAAVTGVNFSGFLGLVDFYDNGSPKEVDIEGSTRVGNRIFWLGSHSHSADTMERTNRARLFATDVSGSGTNTLLTYVGRYDYLKLDLLAWDRDGLHGLGANRFGFADSAAVGVDPKAADGTGFNMEGLCMAPGSLTTAYLAFRAPLVPTNRAAALIVPVTNFTSLAVSGGPPGSARFGTPIELNLGGRGIRSIEGIGTNYLIVAGPAGAGTNLPPPGDFRLFTWNGRPQDAPRERSASLTGLNIEAIVEVPAGPWTADTTFQLISDSGTNVYYGDDIPAKRLPIREFKKFRMDRVALGDVVPPAARIRRTERVGDTLVFEWFATRGLTYRVQMRSEWNGQWTDLPGDVVAVEAVATKAVALADAQRFFQVIAVTNSP